MRMGRTRALVALALSAALLVGCGSEPDLASDDHTHIDPLNPEHMEPTDVATLAMGVILSWKPAQDSSPTDALRRADRWLGGTLRDAARVSTTAPSGVRPDPRWDAWRSSGDSITAVCTPVHSPSMTTEMRQLVLDLSCKQTVLHRSGEMTPLTPETWRTTLTRTSDGWRLADYQFIQ